MARASHKIEEAFLREIAANPQDNTARFVYADWLDEQGDPRGEYLRVHCELSTLPPSDERFQVLLTRERELQAEFDPSWLRKVGQPRIENCDVATGLLRFDSECPKAWNELTSAGNPDIRHCAACQQPVYFCSSIDEARFFAGLGFCIAVENALIRQHGDLNPPPLPEPRRPDQALIDLFVRLERTRSELDQ
jgi:uncharacterized protein (TIGR02996 family)